MKKSLKTEVHKSWTSGTFSYNSEKTKNVIEKFLKSYGIPYEVNELDIDFYPQEANWHTKSEKLFSDKANKLADQIVKVDNFMDKDDVLYLPDEYDFTPEGPTQKKKSTDTMKIFRKDFQAKDIGKIPGTEPFSQNEGMYVGSDGTLRDDEKDNRPVDKSQDIPTGTEIVDVLILGDDDKFAHKTLAWRKLLSPNRGEVAVTKWFDDNDITGEGVVVKVDSSSDEKMLHKKGKLKWDDQDETYVFTPYNMNEAVFGIPTRKDKGYIEYEDLEDFGQISKVLDKYKVKYTVDSDTYSADTGWSGTLYFTPMKSFKANSDQAKAFSNDFQKVALDLGVDYNLPKGFFFTYRADPKQKSRDTMKTFNKRFSTDHIGVLPGTDPFSKNESVNESMIPTIRDINKMSKDQLIKIQGILFGRSDQKKILNAIRKRLEQIDAGTNESKMKRSELKEMIKEAYNDLLKEEDAEQILYHLDLKDLQEKEITDKRAIYTTTSTPEYVKNKLQTSGSEWKHYYKSYNVLNAGGGLTQIVFHRKDQPEPEDAHLNEDVGFGFLIAGLTAAVLGGVAANVGGSLDKLTRSVYSKTPSSKTPEVKQKNLYQASNIWKDIFYFTRSLPFIGPKLRQKDEAKRIKREIEDAIRNFIKTEDGKEFLEVLMQDPNALKVIASISDGGKNYKKLYNIIQKHINEMEADKGKWAGYGEWQRVKQKFFDLRKDIKGGEYKDTINKAWSSRNEPTNESKMKRTELQKILKGFKASTDKETEDGLLDAIKNGEIKNTKEDIKKWLKQNTNQPHKMKKAELKEIIKEAYLEILRENNNFYVYNSDPTLPTWSNKKLATGLTREEAKQFIEDNQHKYKFPLAWEEDTRGTFNINVDDEIFPISEQEDDENVDDVEDDFTTEPAVDPDGESRTQEEAPRKRINFENRELEMLVDVNRNKTKKGIKIQFLSDDELSKEERAKLVSSLQTYLDEGLAKFVKGAKLNVDSDQDVPNKTKTVGFTIKIGDVFGLVSKVFANRGDDEEEEGGEVDFEAEETEETEELQELRQRIRGFLKESFRDDVIAAKEMLRNGATEEEVEKKYGAGVINVINREAEDMYHDPNWLNEDMNQNKLKDIEQLVIRYIDGPQIDGLDDEDNEEILKILNYPSNDYSNEYKANKIIDFLGDYYSVKGSPEEFKAELLNIIK